MTVVLGFIVHGLHDLWLPVHRSMLSPTEPFSAQAHPKQALHVTSIIISLVWLTLYLWFFIIIIMCTCINVPLLHIAGLTIDNVRKALHGIPLREVGGMLFIPYSKFREIEGEYCSDEEREVAVIRYWILRDPFASWRRIIERLEVKGKHDHAITLYHYSEELTGMLGALTTHLMHPNYCYMYVCTCW